MEVFFLILVYIAASIKIVGAKERGVVVILGKAMWVFESGPAFVPFALAQLIRYPKGLMELKMNRISFITRRGTASFSPSDTQNYSAARVVADVSFRFYYPSDPRSLLRTVAVLPHPPTLQSINGVVDDQTKSLFEETITEHVRTTGGKVTWADLQRDRACLNTMIADSFRNADALSQELNWTRNGNPYTSFRSGDIIFDSCVSNPTVALGTVEIPDNLAQAITEPERAGYESDAMIRRTEGIVEMKRRLFEVVRTSEDLQKDFLLALRDMSQGNGNTILPFPVDILSIMGRSTAKDNFVEAMIRDLDALPEDRRNQLINRLLQRS